MITSMTGFGRCEMADEDQKISVEIRSVNSRYLDLGLKMPRRCAQFESNIRELLKKKLSRGKVDVFVTIETFSNKSIALNYDQGLAAEYMKIFSTMSEQFGIPNDVTAMSLAKLPEVITTIQAEGDDEAFGLLLSSAVSGAADRLVEQRAKEGEALKTDIISKLDNMSMCVSRIEARSPEIVEAYSRKLREKLLPLIADGSIDEGRIASEVVIYADKVCVDEEIVRLKSHINAMKDTLIKGGAAGRKLDFLAQEMNREANTILSKSGDIDISDTAISLKTDIEKIREQVQNIE